MRKTGLLLFFMMLFVSVYAQNQQTDTIPDEQTIVHKEYDENGNIISFDSTYVHRWSNSDTTFNFELGDNPFEKFGNIDVQGMLKEYFNDSIGGSLDFSDQFGFSPFDNDEFFRQFNHSFNDSLFNKHFTPDSLNYPGQHFFTPDFEQFEKQLRNHLKQFNSSPIPPHLNLNQKQQKELEELQKRHQKEIEELMKKWGK